MKFKLEKYINTPKRQIILDRGKPKISSCARQNQKEFKRSLYGLYWR